MGNNSSSNTKSKPYPSSAQSSSWDPPQTASQSSRHPTWVPGSTNDRHAYIPSTNNSNPRLDHQESQRRSYASENIPRWKQFQQGNSTDDGQSRGQSSTLQLPVLLALAERETSYIVLYLKCHSIEFSKTLQETESNPSIVVLMKIIRKICIADSYTRDQTQLLKLVCCDKFLNSLNNYVLSLPTRPSDCTKEDLLFIEDYIIQFVDKVLSLFPELICKKLKTLFINVNVAINAIQQYRNIKVNSCTTEKLKKIENVLNFHLNPSSSPSTISHEDGARMQGNSGSTDEEQLNKTTSRSDQAYKKQMEFVNKNVFPEIESRFSSAKRVFGMCKNIFFVNKEQRPKDCLENAEYIFAVAKHLVKNGYEPKSILLLLTTDKEMEIFETVHNKYNSLKGVRVDVLSKMGKIYASIVVVSLMGFELEDLTFSVYDVCQFCRALFQSKCGFYMKGNITFLESKSIFWREMNSILKKYQAVSSELPLQCKIHLDVVTKAGEIDDLIKLGSGGCTGRCNTKLNCGHNCKRYCHLDDRVHKKYKCREKCTRTPPKCVLQHSCPKFCDEECEECGLCTAKINLNNTVIMSREQNTQKQNFASSTENKNVTVLPCGHIGSLEDTAGRQLDLWLPLNNCQNPCTGILQCGHECTGTCGQCRQGRIHIPCQKKRKVSLACGHRLHTSCNTLNVKCGNKCLYKCPHGECKEKCGAPCTPCLELCTLGCQHSKCTKKCSEICDRLPCMASCQNRLDCGHQCVGMCGEPCPPGPEYCKVCNPEFFAERDSFGAARFVLLADCNHVVRCKKLDEQVSKGIHKIEALGCPVCGICITKTTRYLNHAKQLHTNLVTIRNVHEQYNENMSTTFWKIAKEIKSYSLPSNIEKHPKMEEIKRHFPSSKADKVNHKAVILLMFLRNLVLSLVHGGTQMASPNHLDWFLNVLLERIEMGASPQVLRELYREIIEYQRLQGNVFKEQLLELHKAIAFLLNLEKNTWAECTKGHLFSLNSLLVQCAFCEGSF